MAIRGRRVGTELALLVFIVALPLAGMIVWLLYDSARREEAHASGLALQMAATTADRAARYVDSARVALEAIARRPQIRAMDPDNCDPHLADLRELYGRPVNIIVVNLEGRIICGATPPPRDRVVRITEDRLMREMIAAPRFRLSRPLVGQITKRWTVVAVQPVLAPGGTFAGTVSMGIDLSHWVSFSPAEGDPKVGIHAVVTAEGIVIGRSAESEKWIGRDMSASEVFHRMLAMKRGTVRALGTEGADRVWGFTPVEGTGWYALSSISAGRVYGPMRERVTETLILLAVVLGVAAALALAWLARLLRPMRAVANAVSQRAEGRSEVRVPVGGPREVAELAGELNRMIDAGERMERDVRQAEQRFRSIFENTIEGIFQSTIEGRLIACNPAHARSMGYASPEEFVAAVTDAGTQVYVDPDDRRRLLELLGRQGQIHGFQARFRRKDGSVMWASMSVRAVRDPAGKITHILGMQQDITEQKAQRERIDRLSRVHAVLSGINAAIVRIRDREELYRETCRIAVDAGGFAFAWIGFVDRAAMEVSLVGWHGVDERLLGQLRTRGSLSDYAPERAGVVATAVMEKKAVVCNDVANDPRVRLKQALAERGVNSMAVLPLIVSDEAVGALTLHAAEKGFFDDEEMKLLLELAGDVSFALDHIEKEEKLTYLALYDSLTGLANRTLCVERLNQYLHVAGQSGEKLALVVVDVERLRTINDSLGRQAGDALLLELAERLAGVAGRSETAHISADNFTIVLQPVKGRSETTRRVERIWGACFGAPFRLGETEVQVSAKAGIALFPSDGATAETLLRNAEAALKRAKDTGERHVFHAQEMTARTAEKLSLETSLRQALEKGEFVLHYQPKVELDTRRIAGVEALMRWQSPELGLVPPMKFIPLMEETGLILEAGHWALARATVDHARWLAQGLAAPRVAVNVSAIQLRKRDYVATVAEALKGGASPPGVDLEITESLMMQDIQGNIEKLKAVRELGVSIAIDDFGTGYSSLGYLAKLPVQSLKIDRSFIITMLGDPDVMTLVQTIISLAHSLKLKVVAEGVDSEDQAKILRLLRCDLMQGYLFSKPLPWEQMTELLAKG